MNDRILERHDERIRDLEKENASLTEAVGTLVKSVDHLSATVQDLRDTMNRGRGAVWVLIGVSTSIGAAVSAAINKLLT